MSKKKNYILAFMIPLIIFLIVATIANYVPFGKYLFNAFDAYSMYPSLLVGSVKSLFNGDFFFSLGSGLGTDFYNMKTLYMNSPLNLLLLLFGYKRVFVFYTFLIYLRIGLSGITMNIYLNSITKKNKYNINQIIFSTIYALTTYAVACSIHIMWMDAFVLLPIIIMGIDKLVEQKKSSLYIIFLTLTIYINFYIGYMICIFCVIYFIYKSYVSNKLNFNTIKRFLISSVLSGFMCAIVLIPQIISLLGGRGNSFKIYDLFGISKYSVESLVYNFFPASYLYVDNYNDGSALTYITLFAFVLFILYFFNKKINIREKKATLAVIIFFTFSSFVNFIDFTWNMFQDPVWWSHRYIFVYCFFLIITAYKCFSKEDGIKIKKSTKFILEIIIILLAIISFSYKTIGLYLENKYVIYLTIGLILFVIYFNLILNKKLRKFLLVLLIVEIGFNTYHILKINSEKTYSESIEYLNNNRWFDTLKNYDNDVYRVINNRDRTNDSFMFDYYGTSLFSSSYNELPRDFLHNKVGVFDYKTNRINLTYKNPAVLSLLGVKYIIGTDNYFEEVADNVYYNKNYLSLGYSIPSELNEVDLKDGDYYQNVENIYSILSRKDIELYYETQNSDSLILDNLKINDGIISISDVLVSENPYKVNYEFVAPKSGILVPYNCIYYANMNFKINDEQEINISDYHKYVYVQEGDKVLVTLSFDLSTYYFYTNFTEDDLKFKILDMDTLEDAIKIIKEKPQLENLSTKDSVLKGNISLDEASPVMITIPYQKGFTIYVDDKKTDYYKVMETFIGLDVDSGEHEIKVTYIPRGFILGVIISAISLLLTIIYLKKC